MSGDYLKSLSKESTFFTVNKFQLLDTVVQISRLNVAECRQPVSITRINKSTNHRPGCNMSDLGKHYPVNTLLIRSTNYCCINVRENIL